MGPLSAQVRPTFRTLQTLGTMMGASRHIFPFWLHPASSPSDGCGLIFERCSCYNFCSIRKRCPTTVLHTHLQMFQWGPCSSCSCDESSLNHVELCCDMLVEHLVVTSSLPMCVYLFRCFRIHRAISLSVCCTVTTTTAPCVR
jgi:hypothetical protein